MCRMMMKNPLDKNDTTTPVSATWLRTFAVALRLCHLAAAQDFEQGKALWATQCASCHGSTGQGVENHFADPLTGDLSIKELAEVIQATMPEGAPKSLTDPQAQALAQFVHHELYSPYAQLRNSPPKISFSRLTADQYRRSVSNLMAVCNGRIVAASCHWYRLIRCPSTVVSSVVWGGVIFVRHTLLVSVLCHSPLACCPLI